MTKPGTGGDRAELGVMLDAASRAGLDPTDARLASKSARLIWHLPEAKAALAVTRPFARTRDEITGEVGAVNAARSVGVRTPRLLADPLELPEHRFALIFEWLDGHPPMRNEAWPLAVAEAARLAFAPPAGGLARLRMRLSVPRTTWPAVLGESLATAFAACWTRAEERVNWLVKDEPLVLCHGDLHPANLLIDSEGKGWLVDLEYACLAPAEWDPAKVMILARRFGEPNDPESLLAEWPPLNRARLAACVSAQETLMVGWLLQMASSGTAGARDEARRRVQGLGGTGPRWRHLG